MTANPEVEISVVIVNWNGAEILPRCLEALSGQTFRDFEILIVDNGSQDGSDVGLEDLYPTLQVIRLGKNRGFAAANNEGARQARGRWLAFLNNDAFPSAHWLSALHDAAIQNPDFSSFASKTIQAERSEIIDSAGIVYHTSGLTWNRGFNQPDSAEYQEFMEVFGACAAASMVETSAFFEVGGFDDDYFLYHEDTDLAFRLQLSGRRCLYVPKAVVAHMGSKTTGVESNVSVYYQQRNWLWTYWKDMPGVLFWRFLCIHTLANMIFFVFYLSRKQATSFIKAKLQAIIGLPGIIRKRRQIQHSFSLINKIPKASMVGIDQRTIGQKEITTPKTYGEVSTQSLVSRISSLMDHSWFSPYKLGKKYARIQKIKKKRSNPDS